MGLTGSSPVKPIKPIQPINPIHAQDTNTLTLRIEGSSFFVDNEFFGDRISGYTLPGFVLRPRLQLHLGSMVTLSGGVHWLHLWGASRYPALLSAAAWPAVPDSNRIHLLPWLQGRVDFSNGLSLVVGSLGNSAHQLPLPLYDPDLALVADPEAGVELLYSGPFAVADLWVDWREYIWSRSSVPERFTAGLSGRLRYSFDNAELYLPLHLVGQHEGGQNLAFDHNIANAFNLAAGLGVAARSARLRYGFSCRAMLFSQRGRAAVPFSQGWGLYPQFDLSLQTASSQFSLLLAYWYGKDFVPLLGSYLFSNLSALSPVMVFDRTQLVAAKLAWQWTAPGQPCAFQVSASAYLYPDERRLQYAVGCSLRFNPSFRLLK